MVKFISHRGESMDAPENTLAAFRLSQERNSDGMECDVHLTADGFVVVAHDSSTARMGSQVMEIESSTLEELRSLDVSSYHCSKYPDEKIPLLSETFPFLGEGREYYIELKGSDPALVEAVKKVVEDSAVPAEQIVFISFSRDLISRMKKAMPQCRALWLDGLKRSESRVTAEELIRELDELGVDGIDAWAHPELNKDLVDAVHQAGKIFAVWTVDNPRHAQEMVVLGVDAVTSNCAALLKTLHHR